MLLSLCALGYFVHVWRAHAPLMQAFYLPTYIRTTLPAIPFWNHYSVLMTGSEKARLDDAGDFVPRSRKENHDELGAFLRENVYEGRSLYSVLRWPLIGFAIVFLLLTPLGGKIDRGINSEARDGRLIRGPRIISHWRWNLRTLGKPSHFYIETR
jgi:hypothetical protein